VAGRAAAAGARLADRQGGGVRSTSGRSRRLGGHPSRVVAARPSTHLSRDDLLRCRRRELRPVRCSFPCEATAHPDHEPLRLRCDARPPRRLAPPARTPSSDTASRLAALGPDGLRLTTTDHAALISWACPGCAGRAEEQPPARRPRTSGGPPKPDTGSHPRQVPRARSRAKRQPPELTHRRLGTTENRGV
jgi:hypothetical protein